MLQGGATQEARASSLRSLEPMRLGRRMLGSVKSDPAISTGTPRKGLSPVPRSPGVRCVRAPRQELLVQCAAFDPSRAGSIRIPDRESPHTAPAPRPAAPPRQSCATDPGILNSLEISRATLALLRQLRHWDRGKHATNRI